MGFEIHDQKLYHYFPEPGETEIIIPEGVTAIEKKAFYSAKNLTDVSFPDSLVCIHESAFEDCENLEMLWFPDKLEKIENHAFSYCFNLVQIAPSSISNFSKETDNDEIVLKKCGQSNLQVIEECAFSHCSSLKLVLLSGKMKEIQKLAFYFDENLKYLYIPKDSNCVKIDAEAFRGCLGLTDFFYDGINIFQREDTDEYVRSDDEYLSLRIWVDIIKNARKFFSGVKTDESLHYTLQRYLFLLTHPENFGIFSHALQSEMIPIEIIDKAISYANAHQFYEAQVLLMKYRMQHTNPDEDVRKKFEL